METLERRSERPAVQGNSFGTDDAGPDPLHAVAADLVNAADAAVKRALSTNSQAFLSNMRQEGGQ